MHMVIRAVVIAENENEAIEAASALFDELCERGEFDYYTLFNDHSSIISGPARWGDYPVAAKVDSFAGRMLVTEGINHTMQRKRECLQSIRKTLARFSDDQIIDEDFGDVKDWEVTGFHYHCHCFGEYRGPNHWLYDGDGEGIDSYKSWDRMVKYIDEKKNLDKLWVVPADVHH